MLKELERMNTSELRSKIAELDDLIGNAEVDGFEAGVEEWYAERDVAYMYIDIKEEARNGA